VKGSLADEACIGATNCGRGFLGMSRQKLLQSLDTLALRH
jgi:hypothetical protein